MMAVIKALCFKKIEARTQEGSVVLFKNQSKSRPRRKRRQR